MKNKLRPIGTEFEVEHPPMESSTSSETTITKYRVIAHKRIAAFPGAVESEMAEMIEAIDIRVKKDDNKRA